MLRPPCRCQPHRRAQVVHTHDCCSVWVPDLPDAAFEVVDDYVGLGYGKTTDEELEVQIEATRLTGLIWDPTYTGKALFGLKQAIDRGRFEAGERVVFWHTGGGFAVFAHRFPLG